MANEKLSKDCYRSPGHAHSELITLGYKDERARSYASSFENFSRTLTNGKIHFARTCLVLHHSFFTVTHNVLTE